MKLLEHILNSHEESKRQILSWLCWLKHNCDSAIYCEGCQYKIPRRPPRRVRSTCEVYNVFASKYSNKAFSTPNCWKFKKAPSIPQEPPDLNFLTQLEWDEEGAPVLLSEYTGDSI